MSIAESVLPEFDHEMASTRKMLERVPDGVADWKPHPKSMSLGQLAIHVATLPHWGVSTMKHTAFDLNPPGGEPYRTPPFESRTAAVQAFDAAVAACRAALAEASDADYLADWSLLSGGQTLLTMPRVVCIRSFVLNHLIHHRGQLSVYLRLQDVPIPGVYGPSADDPGM